MKILTRGNMHDYQNAAVDFVIQNPSAGLLLEMGLGKTSITLTAIADLMYDYFSVESVLVIAPPKVAEDTWSEETRKWAQLCDLEVAVCLGTPAQRKKLLQSNADIFVISNANVPWTFDFIREAGLKFDMLVIDELSAFKSTNTARFRVLKKYRKHFNRIVGLTGTPAPNGLIDLWAQIYLLDGGESLGKTVTGFKNTFFYPVKYNGHIVYEWGIKEGSEEEIYKRIVGTCISMKSADYLKMPERLDNIKTVKLNQAEKEQYDYLKKQYCLDIGEDEITAANAAVLSGKLLQMASGAIYDDNGKILGIHDRKLEALEQLIEEANGKPVIVVYSYKHSLSRIQERFSDKAQVRVYKDAKDKEDWNNGKIDLLLIHPKACKYGLNLQQGGSTLVWFDLTWSLDDYLQTNARVWRQGQRDTVVIHHIVSAATIDEKVIKAIQDKDETQNALLRAVRAEISEVKMRA